MAINAVPINSGTGGSSGSTSTTIALGATATLGNLLIAGVSTDANSGAFTKPADWKFANEHEATAVSNVIIWKVSDGTETGVTISWVNNRNNRSYIAEFASTDLDLVSDPVLAEDESNVTTVVTSQSTGTTAAPGTSESLGIAIHAADMAQNVDAGRALTNSYVERVFLVASSNRALFTLATKVVSSDAAQECTYSTSDTGDQMYGQILVFKGAGGATPIVPANTVQEQAIANTSLVQHGVLSVGNMFQLQTIENTDLGVKIVPANLAQTQAIENTDLVIRINPANLVQDQTIEATTVVPKFSIIPASMIQLQALESTDLVVHITPDNLVQDQTIEVTTVDTLVTIQPDNLTQEQFIANVTFGGLAVGFYKGELSVFSAYNGVLKVTNAYTGVSKTFNNLEGILDVFPWGN